MTPMLTLLLACTAQNDPDLSPFVVGSGTDAMWMRRHWIHGGLPAEAPAELAEFTRTRGVDTIFPFLGPMDEQGWPGWRDGGVVRRYEPELAGAFFSEMKTQRPELRIVPWTGGVIDRDVRLEDPEQRAAFAAHATEIVRLGADGVQLNVETMPEEQRAFLDLLRETRAAIGPEATLSVAAYPPKTLLHPFDEVHWSLEFLAEVCIISNDLAVMGYDTALRARPLYRGLVQDWTTDLARTLKTPAEGGCTWRMGVPAYSDDEPWHDPAVETMDEAIRGIQAGLGPEAPSNFRGVALYASWTASEEEWAYVDRIWQRREPVGGVSPDFLED